MNRRWMFCLAVAVLLAFSAAALADTLYLKDGRSFKGKLISDRGGVIKFKTLGGVMDFPKSQVDRVEKSKMPSDEYEERLRKLDENDLDAMMELARWCRESKLYKQRREVLRKILDQVPDYPEARRESRQIYEDGDWVKAPRDIEEPEVSAGDRVEVPETLASVALPEGWKVAVSAGKAVATGPARYRTPPVLTLELGGVEGTEGAFPEKEGWEKPAKVHAGLLAGLRSRRVRAVDRIGRVEVLALLGKGKASVRVHLTALAMEAETFEKAVDLALESMKWKAPPLDYVNEHYGYAMNLPKPKDEWSFEENKVHDVIVQHERHDPTDYAYLKVTTGNTKEERKQVREGFDATLAAMRATGDVNKDEKITFAGVEARYVDGTYLDQGMPWRTRMMLLEHGKRLFRIYFDQHEFGGKKTDSAWDTLMESFRFTK